MRANESRALGATGIRLSTLGLGTAPIGGLFHEVTAEQAAATVRRALDAGVSYIDTAPHYGAGLAERRVGDVLAGRPRDSFVVSTKVGRLLRPLEPGDVAATEGFAGAPAVRRVWDFSPEGVRASLGESLERLGIDRVDVVLVHDPDHHESQARTHALPTLLRMRDEGTVGAIGAGMNQSGMLTRFVEDFDIDVVLLAGRYTLLDQEGLDALLPACLRRGVAVVVGGVYNSGLLADPRPGAPFDYAAAPPELVSRAHALADVCDRHGVPLKAAALQFPFGHPAVVSVLTGVRSPTELDENVAMLEWPIPDELWDDLRAAGLLSRRAPAPEGCSR